MSGDGVVEFSAKGKTWKLAYPNKTLRLLEKATGRKTGKMLDSMKDGADVELLVKVFWYGLLRYQENVTEDEAEELVSPGKLVELVGEGFNEAFGTGEQKGNGADPPLTPNQQTSTGSEISDDGSASSSTQ